jgi:secretion/DNA translocation related CpaE-like protein
MSPTPALLVTGDDDLLDDVLRLAAAAGTTVDVARDAGAALRCWQTAAVVLVGPDLAGEVGRRHPPRRGDVHVVARQPAGDRVFRDAVAVGAGDVVELPAADGWLVELLADAADELDGTLSGTVTIAVVGGSGGAGATTFAAALAAVSAARSPTLLVDLDRWGPGLDRVLGMDDVDGMRWDGLARGAGRLGARSLRAALPRRGRLAVLTWGTSLDEVEPAVAAEVLAAGRRGAETVVVDLPRPVDAVAEEVLPRCDRVVLVAEGSAPAVAATVRTASRLTRLHGDVGLVVRGTPGALQPDAVARAVGLPLVAGYASRRRVPEQVDLGLGPVRGGRSSLAKAARQVLGATARTGRGAA